MFSLRKPSNTKIRQFLRSQQSLPFSYREVGATRGNAPAGYTVDHSRVRLGEGQRTFERARGAIQGWEMFNVGWLRLLWPNAPIQAGTTVGLLTRQFGVWSLNACRIVYVIEEDDLPLRRYGFAYGTLPDHAERGEERFSVEWRRSDDSVWYDIYAFSRPNQFLSIAVYPFTRMLQKRFARDSKRAMIGAVRRSKGATRE
jgi:uncharacterized protein (UPF0548 family)